MSIVRIAQHAGVSTATVSRVLNDFPGVTAETARQVRAAVEALNYIPPQIKRGPKQGSRRIERPGRQTRTIAVLTVGHSREWLQLPVLASALAGICRAAKDHTFRLLLEEAVDPSKPVGLLAETGIDGAVVFISGGLKNSIAERAVMSLKQTLPIVWAMGAESGPATIDHVTPDHHAIAYLALDYLKSKGCQEVAYLTADPPWPLMRRRGQGFANAAYDSRLPSTTYIVSSDPREKELYGPRVVAEPTIEALVARLVAAKPRPTGLFIANDATTVGVHGLLAQHGVRPEQDITLVSCDNEAIRLASLKPRPASIDVGAEEVGWRAVRRLSFRLERIDEPPILIQIAPRLVLPEEEMHAGGS